MNGPSCLSRYRTIDVSMLAKMRPISAPDKLAFDKANSRALVAMTASNSDRFLWCSVSFVKITHRLRLTSVIQTSSFSLSAKCW